MTLYANAADGTLLRVQPGIDGNLAQPVVAVRTHGRRLAALLTILSEALWRGYTHPPAAAEDDMSPNTEGWRRQHERDLVAQLEEVLKDETPTSDSTDAYLVSYQPLEEVARQIARVLTAIGELEVRAAVVAELRAEVEAVHQAEAGDLRERAAQALLLTRSTTNPLHVVAAEQALSATPYGGGALLRIDPAAASVAGARCLLAAASVAGEVAGVPTARVIEESDNIEAVPVLTPTHVLEQMEVGAAAEDVVHQLLAEALAVAEGRVLDADELIDRLTIDPHDHPHLRAEDLEVLRSDQRLCLLDPRRPALDLLEDLLSGLQACWTLWSDAIDGEEPELSVFWSQVVRRMMASS